MKNKLTIPEVKIIKETEQPIEMIIALFSKHKEQLNEVMDETRDRVDNNMKFTMSYVRDINGRINKLTEKVEKLEAVPTKSAKPKKK